MEWREFRLATLGRLLNVTYANILQRAESADNGIYTCTACTTTGCKSASVTIFMLGTLFDLVQGEENGKLATYFYAAVNVVPGPKVEFPKTNTPSLLKQF